MFQIHYDVLHARSDPTTSSCARPAPTPQPASPTSAGSARCWRASKAASNATPYLDRVSPLAVAAILDIVREQVYGSALDQLLDEAAEEVIREATAGLGGAGGRRLDAVLQQVRVRRSNAQGAGKMGQPPG